MKKRALPVLIILVAALLLTGCAKESIYDGTWIADGVGGKIVIKGDTIKTYDSVTDTRPSAKGTIEIGEFSFSYDGLTGKLSADGNSLRMEIEGFANFAIVFTKQ